MSRRVPWVDLSSGNGPPGGAHKRHAQKLAQTAARGKRKGPSAATIQAARERALATISGTYAAEPPTKTTTRSKFSQKFGSLPKEPAIRSKSGSLTR